MRAIIEIKMPENCMECPFCVGSQYSPDYFCGALSIEKRNITQVFKGEGIREDCPLQPVLVCNG